jgi:penicillin G amidase
MFVFQFLRAKSHCGRQFSLDGPLDDPVRDDMDLLTNDVLRRLGAGESIDAVCRAAGISREQFRTLWQQTAASRVPRSSGSVDAPVKRPVEIERDRFGVPHVDAESDQDLFVGFGYAMAQDRLFQLDWLRRKGAGRLAEILGNDGLPDDLVARTVGLNRIARAEIDRLPEETRRLLAAFSAGINAVIEGSRENLPIEFDLLDYRPEPWQPVDCLLIENEFRWYLTGRFPVIAIPELARRRLGDGPLYRAFLTAESDAESILWPGDYPSQRRGVEPVGQAISEPDSSLGSNNWVVSGARSKSGKPAVASDPHIAFEAVSCWYEVHLQGGTFDVAGCAYVGMPAVLIGRNRRMTWGITNNICSQRDLYQEKTSDEHPGCYLFDGQWQPRRELTELIHVRGFGPMAKQIVFSHNGPIVDEILPPPANRTGPVSLKWLGAYQGGWLTALLGANRAPDCPSFREALRPWHVPTFSVVFADVDGNIGYQATGRIPIRGEWERGYRPGWEPSHAWQGLIPFDEMPGVANPPRGFVATANNRVAADDFPFPLAGTWSSGHRGKRIREEIERQTTFARSDHCDLQQDAVSLRAVDALPSLCTILDGESDPAVRHVVGLFKKWNGDFDDKLVAPTVFSVFFVEWCAKVAAARFAEADAAFLIGGIEALAAELLRSDRAGWFGERPQPAAQTRERLIRTTFRAAFDRLKQQFGDDPSTWTWGRLHRLDLKHVLAFRGELGQLLNHGGAGVRGDGTTVCNTGRGPDFEAASGAGYRMICDLGESPAGLWAVDCQSQSGHPGSPHYSDQYQDWLGGKYHFVPLDRRESASEISAKLRLERL